MNSLERFCRSMFLSVRSAIHPSIFRYVDLFAVVPLHSPAATAASDSVIVDAEQESNQFIDRDTSAATAAKSSSRSKVFVRQNVSPTYRIA